MAKQLVLAAVVVAALVCRGAHASFGRGSFPDGFIFGTGSASYQYEGAYKEGGKGPSIWDVFSHIPGKVRNNDTGDVADDFYHRFREDVKLLKEMNMDAFRFSIAWTRILPTGSLSGGINKEGVDFYNSLINEVIANGLKPSVTIFHWDTPLALDTKYGSFLSENIIKDYVDFAEVCFREFGDRVKFWTTFNEPWTYASQGYGTGAHAPGRCSPFVSKTCTPGDSGREPYIVAHHVLLAHAEAVRLYRAKYAASQGGQIGLVAVSHWFVPNRDTPADRRAVQRSLDFMYGWFLDPLVRVPGRSAAPVHGGAGGARAGLLRLPRRQLLHQLLRLRRAPEQRARADLRRRRPRQHVRVPRRRAHRRARVRAHLLQLPAGAPRAAALHQPPLQQPRHLRHGERHRRGEQPEDPARGRAQGRAQDQVPLAAHAVREARNEERRQRQGVLHLDLHGLLRVGGRLPGPLRAHLHRPPQRAQALPQAVQLLDREIPQEVRGEDPSSSSIDHPVIHPE